MLSLPPSVHHKSQGDRCSWVFLPHFAVIPQLGRGGVSTVTLASLPLHPQASSCLCLFLGKGRERSQAERPSLLQASSLLALVLLPAESAGGDQKTTHRGRGHQQGEGMALTKVRAQRGLAGDSSPAGRHSGSPTTSGPRSSQAL